MCRLVEKILRRVFFSDLGMYDRVIVQDVIKSIAQSQQIDPNARHQFKGTYTSILKLNGKK